MAVPLIPSRQRNIVFFNELKGRAAGVPLPTRKIDLVDGLRDRPMKILCLGYSRTGTVSLFTALTMLGYKPYHMAVAVQNASVELPCWADGLEAKRLGKGEPWGKEEFDKILGRYDAVLDVPAILFAEELITAYPDAKVILTERPVKDWLKSMRGSVGEAYSWQRWKYVAWADKDIAAPLYQLVGQTLYHIWNKNDFRENSKTQQDYLDHYKLVRRVSPPGRLLEYKLGSGWGPLCEFLGVEVPGVPYPHVNDREAFIEAHKLFLNRATVWAIQKLLAWTTAVGILVGVAWYCRKSMF